VLQEERGLAGKHFTCPYHAWMCGPFMHAMALSTHPRAGSPSRAGGPAVGWLIVAAVSYTAQPLTAAADARATRARRYDTTGALKHAPG
jgi:hypothetical protein